MVEKEKDIVERLEAAHFSDDYPLPPSEYRDLCGQAADEIERLRAELGRYETWGKNLRLVTAALGQERCKPSPTAGNPNENKPITT